MLRRDFLRYGGAGLVTAGAGGAFGSSSVLATCDPALAACSFNLEIRDLTIEMIDGQKFRHLAFRRLSSGSGSVPDNSPRVPGPVLRVLEGQTVTITIRNQRPEPHAFQIPGVGPSGAAVSTGSIPGNGGIGSVTFTAPVAGTYIYLDPSHPSEHLYRMLGLHGVLVVHPISGRTSAGSLTPYSMDKLSVVDPAAALTISKVFDAFGTNPRFPGGKWVPAPATAEYAAQERIWLFHEVDPDFNTLIHNDGIYRGAGDRVVKRAQPVPASAQEMVLAWAARYFTINGKSGFDLSDDPSVVFKNYVGEPSLIRTVCTGLCHHSAHIHGNHVLQLAHSYASPTAGLLPPEGTHRTGQPGEPFVHDNVWERDTWPTWPMQTRDVLLPFEAPGDIPDWKRFELGTNQEPFPMRFVMHDHCEMGTTAAGGNYPQGAVTHWELKGPLQRRPS